MSEQAPSEEGTDGQTDDVVADRLRKFNQSLSKKTPASSLGGGGVAKETTVEETSDASLKSVSPDTDNSSQVSIPPFQFKFFFLDPLPAY